MVGSRVPKAADGETQSTRRDAGSDVIKSKCVSEEWVGGHINAASIAKEASLQVRPRPATSDQGGGAIEAG